MLEISDLNSLNLKNEGRNDSNIIIPKSTSKTFDKLKELIDSGEMFEKPEKIHELKKQKLIEFYKSNEAEYLGF